NNGGWQWASGSGCDAAPYFRIFNPITQQHAYDRDEVYIRKWLPEYHSSTHYLNPIIEHTFARDRALVFLRQANRLM
ncbi:MAG TPA: FAD-binding domain-containing protein, partial [Syntrophomonas sp.]|nr:FAD-binding domain-containing protein [Syntrophomonas sp.]